ncbi:MAG: c-type cytochrome [Gammaproteobacteria bacterium]
MNTRKRCGTERIRHAGPLAALALCAILPVHAAADRGLNEGDEARRELIEAARLVPNTRHGAELFETCAACHGRDGLGASDGSVPAIAGQHGSVLLKQLVDFRHNRRWDERMQHFSDRHHLASAQELTDVTAYVSGLRRFAPRSNATGTGEYLHQGTSVYFRVCEACHRPLGQGDLLHFRPRLAGQHYQYLLKQLNDMASGNRQAVHPAHVERLRILSPEDLMGVADYLSRLSPELSSDSVIQASRP